MADREGFQAMVEYGRKDKGKMTHVVFADLSRLARNVSDQSLTLTTFKRLGITPISCDKRIEDSAAGRLSTNMLGVLNEFFSDNLGERVRYRMSAGVQARVWLWLATHPLLQLNRDHPHGPQSTT